MSVSTLCQSCGARLRIPNKLIGTGKPIACPRCRAHITRIVDEPAAPPEPPPVRQSPPKDEAVVAGLPPSSVIGEVVPEPIYDPYPVSYPPPSPGMALPWALAIVVGLVSFTILGIAIVRTSQPQKSVVHEVRPQLKTSNLAPTRTAEVEPAREFFSTGNLICIGSVVALVYIVTVILILIYMVKDARSRGLDGGIWVIVILISGWIGLIVYVATRPYGTTVLCEYCGNKRLAYGKLCPHCGRGEEAVP